MQRYFLFAVLMFCTVCAYAQDAKTDRNGVIEKPMFADTPATFAAQTQRIHEDMQTGGRYEFTSPTDRQRVDTLLQHMANLLQSAGSVEAMNHDTRIVLFNTQEEVNGILKHNDSNRLVCASRAAIGSNILRTTCHAHGQIETAARNTKQGLMEFDHSRLCNSSNPTSACMPANNRSGH